MDVPKLSQDMNGGKKRKTLKKKTLKKSMKKGGKSVKADVKAYCMKCKGKVGINGGKQITMKNKRKAIKGNCMDCKGKVFRII
ncbi:hypothetical protein CL656_03620 [bacterium]|nr:hypothetical protein [bacterium]|tara:strand:- start:395 stop:643 length:249 start_codon:yes stop_codon:yes gene_type:complete